MNKQRSAEDDFLITDPEKHPGVVLKVKAGERPRRLEPIGYLADTEVRCAFCPQRQRHRRGFFAVLADESLALCGNCCAEKIAGKSTVAKIKRDIQRREEVAAARRDIALLGAGLAPVIEILTRNWLPLEKEVHRHVYRLKECFFTVKTPKMAKLSHVAAGLQDIVSAATTGSVSNVKSKRARALDMISEGVSELNAEVRKLDLEELRRLVDRDDFVHGYYRTRLEGRSLYLLDTPSWADPEAHDSHMNLHMKVPKINLPDKGPLMEAVKVARLVAP